MKKGDCRQPQLAHPKLATPRANHFLLVTTYKPFLHVLLYRETQTRSAERKDAIFKFSNSIGLLVELCSEVIGQDVKGLLRDLIKIEQDYVVQNEVDLLNFDL
jgi:hypothetical protein